MLREKTEEFWEKTGKSYLIAKDGRKLFARSMHSLLNLLFQNLGSLCMKYTYIFTCQMLEQNNQLSNIFFDSREEAVNKACSMIIYHDEVQFAFPKHWYKYQVFETEEEGLNFREENNLPTPVRFSDKINKYFIDHEQILTPTMLEAVEQTIKVLDLKVQLKIDTSVGTSWGECH